MIKIYVRKCKSGAMLWTAIPELWQNKVVTQLINDGYVCNEDGTVTLKSAV